MMRLFPASVAVSRGFTAIAGWTLSRAWDTVGAAVVGEG
jgi:hypothetical protein